MPGAVVRAGPLPPLANEFPGLRRRGGGRVWTLRDRERRRGARVAGSRRAFRARLGGRRGRRQPPDTATWLNELPTAWFGRVPRSRRSLASP